MSSMDLQLTDPSKHKGWEGMRRNAMHKAGRAFQGFPFTITLLQEVEEPVNLLTLEPERTATSKIWEIAFGPVLWIRREDCYYFFCCLGECCTIFWVVAALVAGTIVALIALLAAAAADLLIFSFVVPLLMLQQMVPKAPRKSDTDSEAGEVAPNSLDNIAPGSNVQDSSRNDRSNSLDGVAQAMADDGGDLEITTDRRHLTGVVGGSIRIRTPMANDARDKFGVSAPGIVMEKPPLWYPRSDGQRLVVGTAMENWIPEYKHITPETRFTVRHLIEGTTPAEFCTKLRKTVEDAHSNFRHVLDQGQEICCFLREECQSMIDSIKSIQSGKHIRELQSMPDMGLSVNLLKFSDKFNKLVRDLGNSMNSLKTSKTVIDGWLIKGKDYTERFILTLKRSLESFTELDSTVDSLNKYANLTTWMCGKGKWKKIMEELKELRLSFGQRVAQMREDVSRVIDDVHEAFMEEMKGFQKEAARELFKIQQLLSKPARDPGDVQRQIGSLDFTYTMAIYSDKMIVRCDVLQRLLQDYGEKRLDKIMAMMEGTEGIVNVLMDLPVLPMGLKFDESTGTISGTPLKAMPETRLKIIAESPPFGKNTSHEATITFTISELAAPTILTSPRDVEARLEVGDEDARRVPLTPTTPTPRELRSSFNALGMDDGKGVGLLRLRSEPPLSDNNNVEKRDRNSPKLTAFGLLMDTTLSAKGPRNTISLADSEQMSKDYLKSWSPSSHLDQERPINSNLLNSSSTAAQSFTETKEDVPLSNDVASSATLETKAPDSPVHAGDSAFEILRKKSPQWKGKKKLEDALKDVKCAETNMGTEAEEDADVLGEASPLRASPVNAGEVDVGKGLVDSLAANPHDETPQDKPETPSSAKRERLKPVLVLDTFMPKSTSTSGDAKSPQSPSRPTPSSPVPVTPGERRLGSSSYKLPRTASAKRGNKAPTSLDKNSAPVITNSKIAIGRSTSSSPQTGKGAAQGDVTAVPMRTQSAQGGRSVQQAAEQAGWNSVKATETYSMQSPHHKPVEASAPATGTNQQSRRSPHAGGEI